MVTQTAKLYRKVLSTIYNTIYSFIARSFPSQIHELSMVTKLIEGNFGRYTMHSRGLGLAEVIKVLTVSYSLLCRSSVRDSMINLIPNTFQYLILTNRTFTVILCTQVLSEVELGCSVPRGLRPLLFILYTTEVADIVVCKSPLVRRRYASPVAL